MISISSDGAIRYRHRHILRKVPQSSDRRWTSSSTLSIVTNVLVTYHWHKWRPRIVNRGHGQQYGHNRTDRLCSVWNRARLWNYCDCRLAGPAGRPVCQFHWRSDSAEVQKTRDADLASMRTTMIVHCEYLRTKIASELDGRSYFHIESHRLISLFHLWRHSDWVDEFARNQLENNHRWALTDLQWSQHLRSMDTNGTLDTWLGV